VKMSLHGYIIFAVLLFGFRLIFINHPVFVVLPPFRCIFARYRAVFDPNSDLKLRSRILLGIRTSIYLFLQPFWTFLWTLDDIFFREYKAVEIKDPVFIIGGFRTGSTSLHRSLALDTERYCSPRFFELGMPFLVFHKFLRFLEKLDEKYNTKCISSIEKVFQKIAGEEAMARHPMSYYEAEECDVLLTSLMWSGWYHIALMPDRQSWFTMGQISHFSRQDQEKLFTVYNRAMQKMLYHRGNGRTLLSKSHLIEFLPIIREKIKSSHFVGIIRHPESAFVSWYSLAQHAGTVMAFGSIPKEAAVSAHLLFWAKYYAKEMEFFVQEDQRHAIVKFNDYIKAQEDTMKVLYEKFGFPFENTPFQKAILASNEAHQSYKNSFQYVNPTLAELGLTVQELETRYVNYIQRYGLQKK